LSSHPLTHTTTHTTQGERVKFTNKLKARSFVENWMLSVEGSMESTLRKILKNAVNDYDTFAREKWVFMHPGQVRGGMRVRGRGSLVWSSSL